MAINMLVNLKAEFPMDRVLIRGLMEESMLVNLKVEFSMGRVLISL